MVLTAWLILRSLVTEMRLLLTGSVTVQLAFKNVATDRLVSNISA